MKFAKIAMALAVMVALAIMVGCSKTETRLVGKWKNQSLPEIVEFKSDKSGVFIVKDMPPLPFSWSITGKDNMKLDVSYHGQVRSLTGSLEKNQFVLNGQGEQAVYTRME